MRDRGKRKDTGEWVFGFFKGIPEPKPGKAFISAYDKDSGKWIDHEVIYETVCQYSTVEDKNGKRIYEQDIVRAEKTNELFIIVWRNRSAGFKAQFLLSDSWHELCFPLIVEEHGALTVIGNLHDNPELLPKRETK